MTRPPAFDPARASSTAATRDGPRHNPARARHRALSLTALGLLIVASHRAEAQSALSMDIPISLRTDDVRKALESTVPAAIEQEGAWTYVDGWGLKFAARRGAFTVTTTPDGLAASVLIEYRAKACRRIGHACPQVASCGDGEPLAATQLEVAVTGTWSRDWSFIPRADVHATPVRPCRVTSARRDVGPWISAQLESKARAAIDGLRGRLQLRSAAEARWASAAVREIGNHLWLILQPDRVAIAPMTGHGDQLRSTATIWATPSLVAQEVRPTVPPLPALTVLGTTATLGDSPPAWHMTLTAPWSSLASTVAALPLDLGHGITGQLTGLRGTNDGHILGILTVTGTLAGPVSLDAEARYDAGSDAIVVVRLVAAPRTDAIASGVIAVVSSALLPRLRWPVGPALHRVVERLAYTGWVTDLDASRSTLTVTVSTAGFVLDVMFAGSLTLPVSFQP